MENTKIKKLNRMLFMLGTLVKRVEIKNNKITDIKFKSNVEDYSFVREIITEEIIPLLDNKGIFINYNQRIINVYDKENNLLMAREFDLSVANEIGHLHLGEVVEQC
mgnify:FL=1|jgi:hypothetical protein